MSDNAAFELDEDQAEEEAVLAELNASIEDLKKSHLGQDGLFTIVEEGSHSNIRSALHTEDHEAVQMEDVNQKLERKKKRERLYFDSDPDKRIDYVLVYKDNPDEKEASAIEKVDTRRIFEENLKKGGLELEYENSGDNKSHCIKLHVTWPTLAKIATVLYLPKRIRMPKDYGHSEGCLAGCCSSFEVGEPVLQEEDDYFTAEFDKDNLKMFDFDPENVQERRNFFTPAERSIVCKEVLDRTTFSFSKGVSKFGDTVMLFYVHFESLKC